MLRLHGNEYFTKKVTIYNNIRKGLNLDLKD